MDSDKIEAAILEARKVADKELTGDKLRALLNENSKMDSLMLVQHSLPLLKHPRLIPTSFCLKHCLGCLNNY